MNPIGVGFLDLNPEGLFHLERMRLRTDFLCLTECGPEQATRSVEDLIRDPRVELLWIGPQAGAAAIKLACDAGKQVLLGLPVGTAPSEWQSWIGPRSTTASPLVAALHRWDGQFRTIQQVVRQGELGQITDVQRISRQYVPGELSLKSVTSRGAGDLERDTLRLPQQERRVTQLKWFEMLDELLLLVPNPVASVTARPTGSSQTGERTGCCVTIEFESGCRASLELNRQSLAPLETGWILDGTAAGFTDGKRYQAGADFELIDVPVEELSTDQDAFYNALVATLRGGEDFPVTADSIRRVLRLQEQIETSLRTATR